MSVLNGVNLDAAAVPFAVIVPTAAAVAEVFDWQNKCVVFVIFVSGTTGGLNSYV